MVWAEFENHTLDEAKNNKIRRIAINKSLRALLLKLNLTRNGNRYVFENPKTGKPYTDLKRNYLPGTSFTEILLPTRFYLGARLRF